MAASEFQQIFDFYMFLKTPVTRFLISFDTGLITIAFMWSLTNDIIVYTILISGSALSSKNSVCNEHSLSDLRSHSSLSQNELKTQWIKNKTRSMYSNKILRRVGDSR